MTERPQLDSLRVGILAIGNELLDGLILDTNSNWMEKQLASVGAETLRVVSVRDDVSEIGEGLRFLLSRCDIVITTGGMGPTHDDKTLLAVATATDRALVEDPAAVAIVKRQYAQLFKRGIVDTPDYTAARRKMACIPEGSKALDNQVGGAPGVQLSVGDATVFCLPGVPPELKSIFEHSVLPWIRERVRGVFFETVVQFATNDESLFAPLIDVVMRECPGVYIKSMPRRYERGNVLRVWMSARGASAQDAERKVNEAIGRLSEVSGLPAMPAGET
ncbi:MAG: competence/damage-inducible protein A [Candidatus Thorarchaeota archaeon]|nr:competence/damage-inducible protein A [Candidatus Thorarchaeota archaeon]